MCGCVKACTVRVGVSRVSPRRVCHHHHQPTISAAGSHSGSSRQTRGNFFALLFLFSLSPSSSRPTLSLSRAPSLSRRSVSSHADRLFGVAPASSPLPFVIIGFGGLDGVMRDTVERLGFLWITTTATAAGHSADTVVSSRQQSRSSL